MTLTEAVNLLQSVGFPALMVVWFMLRTETVIRANTSALQELAEGEIKERQLLATLVLLVCLMCVAAILVMAIALYMVIRR
jgi:uncharacterized membrane protein (Fun14 family)